MGRVEAFTDGVIAIIVTIMVLELKAPEEATLSALLKLKLIFLDYLLSFVMVAILWVNHRPLIKMAHCLDGGVLWSNNNLLFWMSLIPFATAYMGATGAAPLAVCVYGLVMAATAAAFTLLRFVIAHQHKDYDDLKRHHNKMHMKDFLGTTSYLAASALAFVSVTVAFAIFVIIPALYFIPDRRLETLNAD